MGRGRLRRGCSLEVIFEEDPEFCSHLDSLDGGVAIRFGIKEPDDTISLDSLLEVEEYQVRFEDPADAEQVFRSLDGFIDVRNMDSCMVEWDEFSMDSNSSRAGEESGIATTEPTSFPENNDLAATNNAEKPPSGRRSRVSRRQIIQATWLGYSSSSDESVTNNDPDDNDNSSGVPSSSVAPAKPPRRRSPSSRLHNSKQQETVDEDQEKDATEDGSSIQSSSVTSTPSTSTTVTSIETDNNNSSESANMHMIASLEDFLESDEKDEEAVEPKTPIQIRLSSSPALSVDGAHQEEDAAAAIISSPPYAIFGRSDTLDVMEKDTLDSYISTMTDETDANAYTFADPFDDTHSVASTSYESSGSTSSTESNGSVCTVNSFSMQSGKSKSNDYNASKNTNSGSEGVSPTLLGADVAGTGNCSGGSGSKYRSNLKVELVSQLNKSHQENLHPSSAPSASGSVVVNPSNLYSRDLYPSLQSSPSTSTNNNTTPQQQRQPHHPLQLSHHQHQQSLTDNERQACAGEVKRVRALFELRNHTRTSVNGSDSSSNGSTCPSSPESMSRSFSSRNGGDTSPSGSCSGRIGLYSKNGRRSRASPQNHRGSAAGSPSKLLRSSNGTNPSLTQNAGGGSNSSLQLAGSSSPVGASHQSSYDYVDILVNENVIIEDAPDIYQAVRSRRQANFDRDSIPSPPTTNKRPVTLLNLSPREGTGTGSLRRSQSMGTGISSIGGSSLPATGILKQSVSKTNILAEELPAPDTVKNVRNVFENMLKMKSNNHGSSSSVDMSTTTPTGFSGSFSIVKKSLSYIKSNPTSKIYRSESMRDDFPSMGRRFGKPILMSETNSPVHSPSYSSFAPAASSGSSQEKTTTTTAATADSDSSGGIKFRCTAANTSEDVVDGTGGGGGRGVSRRSSSVSPMNKNPIERKISEPAKFSPKINTGLSPYSVPSMLRTSCQVPLTEEDPSFLSNISSSSAVDDYRSRKHVHPEVLNKIRSAGTTTTYFGGKIVAKTIKNRKIPLSRRHTFDFQDYVGISGDGTSFANHYDSYSSSNYYRDDETGDNKCQSSTSGGAASGGGGRGRSGSNRPALEIPLKSSASSSIYASQNTTISGALDSIFAGGIGGLLTFASKPIDTTPRIISVLHKSPPGSHTGSPVKSCSPVSSVIEEGRNSPEGCEASNEKTVVEQDGNNNNLPGKVDSSSSRGNCNGESEDFNKKFSEITEGAWF